jgi:hypothetical protein
MPLEPASRDVATLLDVRLAAERVLQFVAGMSSLAFQEDVKTQSAVLHQLLTSARRRNDCRTSSGPLTATCLGPRWRACATI